jgi:dipeptidyl-peptidase-4
MTGTDPAAGAVPELTFPRQRARTQRFTLGVPRNFAVAPDGARVAFLRAPSGTDRATCLWVLDLPGAAERLVADPRRLLGEGGEELSAEERARRERSREGAAGVVSYATDRAVATAAFALSGQLYVADLTGHGDAPAVRTLPAAGPVLDPRPDPTGRHVAYVSAGALRVVPVRDPGAEDGGDRALVEPDGPEVTWGLAEFVAAEEMDRSRGYWWSPDGQALLVARVDESPVQRWHIADPAHPERPAATVAYPAAGTANADVTVSVVRLDGSRTDVPWDTGAFPYLVTAHWSEHGPPLLLVQSRDQRTMRVLAADPASGRTRVVHEETDPVWLDIVPGVPAWLPGQRLLWAADSDGAHRLLVDGEPVTPADLQVRAVLAVTGEEMLVSGSAEEPAEIHLWRVTPSGCDRITAAPGVYAGRGSLSAEPGVLVVSASTLDRSGPVTKVVRGGAEVGTIASHAETPLITPSVTVRPAGRRALRSALVLPTGYEPGSWPLPVLMDPYGGPHAQRVLSARNAYLEPQWLAEAGFAVLVVDGRGSPGRGPAWEREIAFDLAEVTLTDQVDALHAVAAEHPYLDLSRVAIRGWSFGGYLAALAVLRRPDVFAAAVAGAPVTDWRLYDTHYTERYLGDPGERPAAYAANSLLDDAAKLQRPLMLIHGLADDNVVAAHTLKLSSALLEAGRPHTVLPLSGVTHMTPQEVVAENLLLLQVDFLRRALGLA